MFQNKKLKRNATSAIAEVGLLIALCPPLAVGLAPRHLAFKTKLFILCSIAEAIVSVQWFFWLSTFCFVCLKLKWCCCFFSEYKITHQQASFKCVDSVFTHGLLARCFKSNHN